jgi:uncharacterized membrane protein
VTNNVTPRGKRRSFILGIVLFSLVLLLELHQLFFVHQKGFAVATSWILVAICVIAIAWGAVGLRKTPKP